MKLLKHVGFVLDKELHFSEIHKLSKKKSSKEFTSNEFQVSRVKSVNRLLKCLQFPKISLPAISKAMKTSMEERMRLQ
jgi:hypothetical protein